MSKYIEGKKIRYICLLISLQNSTVVKIFNLTVSIEFTAALRLSPEKHYAAMTSVCGQNERNRSVRIYTLNNIFEKKIEKNVIR